MALGRVSSIFAIGLVLIGHASLIPRPAMAKTVHVGALEAPPYIISPDMATAADPRIAPYGVLIDAIRLAGNAAGVDIAFTIGPWPDLVDRARRGSIEALIPTFHTPERERYLLFSDMAMTRLPVAPYKLAHTDIRIDPDLVALRTLRVGQIARARIAPAYDQLVEQGTLQVGVRSSWPELVAALVGGRFDVIMGPSLMIEYAAFQMDMKDAVAPAGPVLLDNPAYFAISRASPRREAAVAVRHALESMAVDGTIDDLLALYVGD